MMGLVSWSCKQNPLHVFSSAGLVPPFFGFFRKNTTTTTRGVVGRVVFSIALLLSFPPLLQVAIVCMCMSWVLAL